jgi:hypothetical protein
MSSDDEDKGQEQTIDNEFGSSEDSLERSTPFTIVWTTLPVISWVLPFIGHTGITE